MVARGPELLQRKAHQLAPEKVCKSGDQTAPRDVRGDLHVRGQRLSGLRCRGADAMPPNSIPFNFLLVSA